MKKYGKMPIAGIIFILLGAAMLLTTLSINVAADDPSEVWIDDDFDSSTSGWGTTHFDKIQDGVDAVAEDGTVFVYGGTYYYENVKIYSSITLEGEDPDTTILQGSGGYSSGYGIYSSGVSDLTIKNLQVKYYYYGIFLYYSDKCEITGNMMTDNINGIYLCYSDGNTVSGNTVTNGDYSGIRLYRSENNKLRDNKLSSNSYNFGITGENLAEYKQDIDTSNTVDGSPIYYWVDRSDATIPSDAGYVGVINSTKINVKDLILTNNYQGILFAYTSGSEIQDVKVQDNDIGIRLFHSDKSIITDNIVIENDDGIYLTHSGKSTIDDNIITENYEGFKIHISDKCKINGNIINYNSRGGSTSSSDKIKFSFNTISNNRYGIFLGQSPDSMFINNKITDNNDYGIFLYQSSQALMTNNQISGSGTGIDLTFSSDSKIVENTISTNNQGIHLRSSHRNIVEDNNLYGNMGFAIWMKYTENNLITSNTVIDNRNGITLLQSWENSVIGNLVKENYKGIRLAYNYKVISIYYNNIIDNTYQLAGSGSDYTSNTWDDGAGKGNYWSDYTGIDDGSGGRTAGDGVGDTLLPHQGVDKFPLMDPWVPE